MLVVLAGCSKTTARSDGAADAGIDRDGAPRDGAIELDAASDDAAGDRDGEGGAPSGDGPLVLRGGEYMGMPERFNRYYTDRAYTSSREIFVSPAGGGDGTRATPSSPADAFARAAAGDRITFLAGTYAGCYELDSDHFGTYDAPIVLYAERNPDGTRAVRIDCCATGRRTCINLEAAHYVAVDGFELVGGRYGVRAVGADYDAPNHQRGVTVLNVDAYGQSNDPFLTGASDWAVFEKNLAHDVGNADGHGIYLSNGGDWNVVRWNETWATSSSDFQINADPQSTCADVGIDFDDPRCDGAAADGLGQGVSEHMTIDGNYFHHSGAQGPNFTSVRRSLVRNNVFGFAARHGTSFWQETDNPDLGSSDNVIVHNLFIGTNGRELLQFIVMSDRNQVRNNVVAGTMESTILINVDGTTGANVYEANEYLGGRLEGRAIENDEFSDPFSTAHFAAWPSGTSGPADPIAAFSPSAGAPFLDRGTLLPSAPLDRAGRARVAPVDLGPLER